MKMLSISSTPLMTSSAVMSLAFFCPTSSPKARMPLVSAARMPGFVGAAVGGRDGVAIIGFVAPSLHSGQATAHSTRPWRIGEFLAAGEGRVGDAFAVAELLGEMVGEAARELEHRGLGDGVGDERGVAAPADLDPGEQIGLGARELVEARGVEGGVGAENLGIGDEADGGAAAVGGGADFLELRGRCAARKGLAVELLSRATSTMVSLDSALTTLTPTPWRPPMVA